MLSVSSRAAGTIPAIIVWSYRLDHDLQVQVVKVTLKWKGIRKKNEQSLSIKLRGSNRFKKKKTTATKTTEIA